MNTKNIQTKTSNLILVISLCLFMFITLGITMHWTILKNIDMTTLNWFMESNGNPQMDFNSGWVTSYFTVFAHYFDVTTIVGLTVLIAIYYVIRKKYLLSIWILFTVGFGGVLGILMKHLVQRERPFSHLSVDNEFSFPSGHSLSSTMLFIIIILLLPNIKNTVLKIVLYYVTIIS